MNPTLRPTAIGLRQWALRNATAPDPSHVAILVYNEKVYVPLPPPWPPPAMPAVPAKPAVTTGEAKDITGSVPQKAPVRGRRWQKDAVRTG